MTSRFSHTWRLMLPLLAVVVVGGCASDPFDAIAVGQTQRQAVAQTLGAQAAETPDGYILETEQAWPKVIRVIHAAVPDGGTVQYKSSLTASVIHMIAVQTLNVVMVYEGPLPDDLAAGLHSPEESQDNEFQARLIDFTRDRMRLGMTEKWKDIEQLRNDSHRSHFVGVVNFAWTDLRGCGKPEAGEMAVDIRGASSTLSLRKLEGDVYRIETRSTIALGPLPIL